MGYDDVILRMGEFGRYQRRIYLLLGLPAIICAFHKLAGVFIGAKMNTRCLLPGEHRNASFYLPFDTMNLNYPWEAELNGYDNCSYYNNILTESGSSSSSIISSTSNSNDNNYNYNNSNSNSGNNKRSLMWQTSRENDNNNINNGKNKTKCSEFIFDTKTYKRTTTSEWKLVCDRGWLRAAGDSLFMVGVMLGSMIFGGLSDKYGRRPIFFLSLVIQLVGGILVAIAPEYISYVIFRLIVGSTTSGVFLVAYVIALEMVGPSKRLIAGVGCQLFFTTGYLLTAVFAYFFNDWRQLQIAITLPSFVFLTYYWFIPESARWLLSNNKEEQAKDLLQKAAQENGIEISRDTMDSLLCDNTENSTTGAKKASLFDLFRYPNLRKKSLLLFFNWLVNSGTYYGLSWNASDLGGNDYVNFVISGAVEVPAYTFLIFTLDRWGRKSILCGCMCLSGISLLSTIFAPTGSWALIVLVMIGKLAITSSYGAIYIFTAEQFPTVVRNVGLGASSTFARIGGVIAPYINYLTVLWPPLPLIIFGTCALLGGAVSLFLPETLHKKLPETILDGELFGLKDKSLKAMKEKKLKLQQLDLQLNDVESIKPLKTIENGLDSTKNG